jgi:hypothetical protein
MNIPVEIFHEILSHLPVTDIIRAEGALDIDIPDYLYLRIHKAKFKSSLDEIKCIECYYGGSSDKCMFVCIRKFGRTSKKEWKCIYCYYPKGQSYDNNKFRAPNEGSNLLSVFTHKLSKSFTDCIDSAEMELFTVKESRYSPTISLMPKGNKAKFGIGNFSFDFVDLSYGIILAEK